jgi:hypothetical protein
LYIGNAAVIWVVRILLFLNWACCCLCIGNAVVCSLGMMLLFVYWE